MGGGSEEYAQFGYHWVGHRGLRSPPLLGLGDGNALSPYREEGIELLCLRGCSEIKSEDAVRAVFYTLLGAFGGP